MNHKRIRHRKFPVINIDVENVKPDYNQRGYGIATPQEVAEWTKH